MVGHASLLVGVGSAAEHLGQQVHVQIFLAHRNQGASENTEDKAHSHQQIRDWRQHELSPNFGDGGIRRQRLELAI
jgi:hypothetical protein